MASQIVVNISSRNALLPDGKSPSHRSILTYRQQRTYSQIPNIRRTLVGNKYVDRSDVAGASPVGAAPTTSSFLT